MTIKRIHKDCGISFGSHKIQKVWHWMRLR